ncbi:MAG: hypothetical protein Q4F53_06770 [Nesterenkonia sp.]|nr:hypothetical protein [Nesterenkonia sp.]
MTTPEGERPVDWPVEDRTPEDRGPGRRGRRRAVAPATSGQPEEVEARPFVPDVGTHAAGADDDSGATPQSRERWFREQRPPHW